MKISLPHSMQRVLPPVFLALSLLTVYMLTLAPGLTWANSGSDGGDLIAAAATGGVPHPTGYPLYLLLARLFQWLPVGSLAFRTNLMSALFAGVAAVTVYEIVLHSQPSAETGWPVALTSGYAFGLAPLVWSQAVITEVYTLQAFLIALVLYLYTKPDPVPDVDQKRLDRWRGLVLGLAMCNHITAVLIVPVAFVVGSLSQARQPARDHDSRSSWFNRLKPGRGAQLRQLQFFATALCLYLILPLRALAQPPVNWGNAITPARFWWLVSGQLYQSYYLQFSLPEAWGRIQSWAGLFLEQFGLPVILLGLIGLIVFGRVSRLYVLSAWTALTFAAFAVFYGAADSYVYLIPVILCFAIWAGLGLGGLTDRWSRKTPIRGTLIGLLVIGYFAARSLALIPQVDASKDVQAESFGAQVFTMAPENAILFAKGDEAVFTLWYFHFALGQRPDLAIIATDLLHFPWYVENLASVYPSLRNSRALPWPETIVFDNPALPVCYVQYKDGAMLDCKHPEAGE